MTMLRKTITIPEQMEEWVKAQIEAGRYATIPSISATSSAATRSAAPRTRNSAASSMKATPSGVSDKNLMDIWRRLRRATRRDMSEYKLSQARATGP